MAEPHLTICSLRFRTGNFQLREINFECRRGEYHILLGPSGSGKTTLLKCILGLCLPDDGTIRLGDRDLAGVPPEERRMGYLPQDYALFPHLSVEGNIRIGLHTRRIPAAEKTIRLNRQYDDLNIGGLKDRDVRTLSGGERQKVALARALVAEPTIILLDEPFSAIDEGSRRLLWFELKEAIRQAGVTAVHITHNLEEAYTLGSRLSVLIDGKIMQSGSREEIFERPRDRSVARYLNYRNIFSGPVTKTGNGWTVELGHFRISLPGRPPPENTAEICIRPQDLKVIREDVPVRETLQDNIFSGEIVSLFAFPEYCLMWFKIDDSPRPYDLELKFPAFIKIRHQLSPGKKIRVAAWSPSIIIF